MIIVLQGADFSQDNIGKISVGEISQYTKDAITASGNLDMNPMQKNALNSFFDTLGAGELGGYPIIKKIKFLYLPMICNDLSKACVNYATSDFLVDSTPTSEQWKMVNGGIVGLNTEYEGQLVKRVPNTFQSENLSFMWMRGKDITADIQEPFFAGFALRGVKNRSLKIYAYQNVVSNREHMQDSFEGYTLSEYVTTPVPAEALCEGFSVRNASDATALIGNEYREIKSGVSPKSLAEETEIDVYAYGIGAKSQEIPTAFAMLGEALTVEEMTKVADAVNLMKREFIPAM